MSEIKFCKDCRYYFNNGNSSIGFCHYEPKFTNPENGNAMYETAFLQRQYKCGIEEARYFEPRVSFWDKLKRFLYGRD